MTELQTYLQGYFHISPNDLAEIAALYEPTRLAKGEFYVKKGHYCDKMSFIKSGLIRIFADNGKKEVTQWISTKGYFVTDISSLVYGTPARWSMQALEDCELYTISKENYDRIAKLIPEWHQLERRFLATCFMTLEDRVFSQISMSAEERYTLLFDTNPNLFNEVPLQYLASMLGMTPETFSRIRAKRIS